MSKFQVTQELYEAVIGNNPSRFQGTAADRIVATGEIQGKRPVEWVSWYDAIVFCNRLSIREGLTPAYEMQTEADTDVWSTNPDTWGDVPTLDNGRWAAVKVAANSNGYRLPTEAQWEYACRAGTDPTWDWHFGNEQSELVNYAWYDVDSSEKTRQVGLKLPNTWGLHDMHGNVSEWCWDWWNISVPFPNPADLEDPEGAASGTFRVIRDGSWISGAQYLRSAHRNHNRPIFGSEVIGFRLVRPYP
jgi:formylglycine-generating enzyme required for sulfatase activity